MSNYHILKDRTRTFRDVGRCDRQQGNVDALKRPAARDPWRELMNAVVMAKHRRGELEPEVVQAFLDLLP
jgi:hypothetical protein